ncbi:cytochrome-c peroxidase [Roseibium aestuarii]|uniref:Cytochrome-c peroxidase n=1 Tax=Roseibium aestuarii TaxID=2600299 RepID=A0ABW4JZU0_9HYPH|nr:cytochrome c peroxidase [Roseibium aestuarii]
MHKPVTTLLAFLAGAGLLSLAPASVLSEPLDLATIYARPISEWPAPETNGGVVPAEMAPLTLLPAPEAGSAEALRVELGAKLFADPRLSGSGQIACESCHNRQLGFGDGLRRAVGHDRQEGTRNAPNLRHAAYRPHLFWDGRVQSLEEQAGFPIINPIEMAGDPGEIEERLRQDADYPALFREAFGAAEIRFEDVTAALAAFERQLEAPTRFDRFLAGERELLNAQQLRGLHLFRTKARCMTCHNGPLLSDGKFHNLGIGFYGRELEDLGRYVQTGEPSDVAAFSTGVLRRLKGSAPYMHNGLVPNLRAIVTFYNAGTARPKPRADQAEDRLFPTTSPLVAPLRLTGPEMRDLEAFLEAL